MEKQIFKVGDRVYHNDYGWGEIDHIEDNINDKHPIQVTFEEDTKYFTIDGRYNDYSKNKSLSFTEYTLQGFSQERPIELPNVGELCLVRNTLFEDWELKCFLMYENGVFYTKTLRSDIGKCNDAWLKMKRIKILD
jgi:hypothetical protein